MVRLLILKTYQWAEHGYFNVQVNGYSANFKTQMWIKLGANQYYKLETDIDYVFFPKEIYPATHTMLISNPVQTTIKNDLIQSLQ